MIPSFVFMLQQGHQCQSPFCNVVSISVVGASATKNQIHLWTHTNEKKDNMTLGLHLNKPNLHQPSKASHWNHVSRCAGSYVSLRISWCWSVINFPNPQYPLSRGLIKACLCPGDPICQNSPVSHQSIILLWTNTHSPQYCRALWRVYATLTWYLCLRHMHAWRPGSSTVLQKAQSLSVLVRNVKCANFIQVALLIVFYCKTHIYKN